MILQQGRVVYFGRSGQAVAEYLTQHEVRALESLTARDMARLLASDEPTGSVRFAGTVSQAHLATSYTLRLTELSSNTLCHDLQVRRMHPCESVAEYVVDVTVRADREGFADHYADAYDASALRAANHVELAAVPVYAEARLERTHQVLIQ